MITLPAIPAPNGMTVRQVDVGFLQRSATGAVTDRINRAGNHYAAEVSFPIMKAETARVFVGRLQRAQGEVLRLPYPLLGISQGSPGETVVDGTGVAGTSLPIKGGTPGHMVKEGYWLNVVDDNGAIYLHSVVTPVRLDADGEGTLTIWPALRAPISDEAVVNLASPSIEGYVQEISHSLVLGNFVQLGFTLEEAA